MISLGIHHKTGLVAVALLALVAQPAAVTDAPAAELAQHDDDQPSPECSLPAEAPATPGVDADAVTSTVTEAEEQACEAADRADELVDRAEDAAGDTADLTG